MWWGYLDPPEKAIVLCASELNSPIQALDRTQPRLPLERGKAQTLTHDDKRHGTSTRFAALQGARSAGIGQCLLPRHRHDAFLRFRKHLDRVTPQDPDLHLIVDKDATHKPPNVRAWLEQPPRVQLHFTPASASWLKLVEGFYRALTEDPIRRGVFRSVSELQASITQCLQHRNQHPKPYRRTAQASDRLDQVQRAHDSSLAAR